MPPIAITDNALFHSSSHINQKLPQFVHILRFCLIDMLPQILESTGLGQGCSAATNMKFHMGDRDYDLLDYCTFELQAVNDPVSHGRHIRP